MSEIIAVAKPFLKWVGGKTQLLDEISKYYPEKIEKYCEPFVGGGAVLFDVLTKFQPKEVLINDINPELISNDSPLIGRGLGLDSIDALELSISISTEFDITVNDSDIEMFGSINKIIDFIIEKQDEQSVSKEN